MLHFASYSKFLPLNSQTPPPRSQDTEDGSLQKQKPGKKNTGKRPNLKKPASSCFGQESTLEPRESQSYLQIETTFISGEEHSENG